MVGREPAVRAELPPAVLAGEGEDALVATAIACSHGTCFGRAAINNTAHALPVIREERMDIRVVNIREKADLIRELHSYKVIAQMNNYLFRLVKAKRTFVWHRHPETDEVFICIQGRFRIELRDRTLNLKEGGPCRHSPGYGTPAGLPGGVLRDAY